MWCYGRECGVIDTVAGLVCQGGWVPVPTDLGGMCGVTFVIWY